MSAKQILQKFDKNNDGKLSLEEFREAALAFSKNIPDEEITKMFKEFDVDGDGELDADEFTLCINNMLKEAFDFCDTDGDGKVTASEFHAAMTGLGEDFTEEKCAEMVQAVDADGDGYVSFEEFMAMIIGEFKK
ncbi:hypothetical protein Bca4012_097890 [Brassica carinata]|uniref:EF-hand domain-containing protein n=4 Tax=Brassica TaxID=3705 RepID=A0A8S9PGD5_BRACR|nr:probable calcium-binding protein CML34 [Brassica napus]XP_048626592.1 probable calcium-binding protein CML34 [Brassica napus]XP_048626594.1 probable calcium-binding protein CML34 [Brassica napus]KAF3520449.1 hypothetical protein DY000_02059016 [Brassica cretica]KAG2250469.1 hypothetical protein Bca52824_080605 [Brassica carinata]KAF3521917.1 hypothetical protein F2Q69_00046550 [Brassica cretica]KAH0854975.1 hypothetical protein HID58_024529 [Brassica napus]KAH0854980.1 hypothetical protei